MGVFDEVFYPEYIKYTGCLLGNELGVFDGSP